eukprot:5333454-Pyramimonas_sp.AAC.1
MQGRTTPTGRHTCLPKCNLRQRASHAGRHAICDAPTPPGRPPHHAAIFGRPRRKVATVL